MIGHISLGNVDRINESARIGKVLIGPSESRGNGYGTQLMLAALTFAFEELNLHKVTLGVFDFNTSAIKCYEKVGFKKEGLLRDARKNGDEYWNLIEMGILESEWKSVSEKMNYIERFVVELEDGTFALWGQFVEGEDQSIITMDNFCDATLFHKEYAERKIPEINKGVWKFLGEAKKAKNIRKVELTMI